MSHTSSYLSRDELIALGFGKLGQNVLLSAKTSIYNAKDIEIGNDVRIDDFCVLSGRIILHNNIHIATGCYLFAGVAGITMYDYSGLSSRCSIYAVTDDYSGEYLTNPTIPEMFRHVISGAVTIGKHAIIGTGCTILPNVTIGEGGSAGSMSLINKDIDPFWIYAGIPAKKMKERSRKLLALERIHREGSRE